MLQDVKVKLYPGFRVYKSVHHHTFNLINQPDATTSQVYYLSFKHSSKCFGHHHAHHQELTTTVVAASGFNVGVWW